MSITLLPFEDKLLAKAATLLSERHRQDRGTLPELPTCFEEAGAARAALEAAWRRPRASGVAALEKDRVMGFLIGDTTVDTLMGRTAWMRLAGHALERGDVAELYRDLYAAAAPSWLAQGCFDHYVMVPASDGATLDAWFALGFGQQQAYGLCALAQVQAESGEDYADFEIRRATPGDRAALVEVADTTLLYQTRAPVWAATPPEFIPEVREGYAEILNDETVTVWLAVRHKRVVGFQGYFPVEAAETDLMTPEGCIELKIAATREEERGRGVGRALTRHGLADAQARGYHYCLTDWRVTNLQASRFWPRRGFRPVVYRLTRSIDPRIAWARERNDRKD